MLTLTVRPETRSARFQTIPVERVVLPLVCSSRLPVTVPAERFGTAIAGLSIPAGVCEAMPTPSFWSSSTANTEYEGCCPIGLEFSGVRSDKIGERFQARSENALARSTSVEEEP